MSSFLLLWATSAVTCSTTSLLFVVVIAFETQHSRLFVRNARLAGEAAGVADAGWFTQQHQHPGTGREWVFGVKVE